MASPRAIQFLALRAPRVVAASAGAARLSARVGGGSVVRRSFVSGMGVRGVAVRGLVGIGQRRAHSGFPSEKRSREYGFEDVLSVIESPSTPTLLIDVREPSEYSTNSIPLALNIPVSSQPDALLLSPEDFQDRFGFQKPPLDQEIVFFCKAGVRSRAAAQLAVQAGYTRVGEYRGSWVDWERRGGPGTRTGPGEGGKGEPWGAEVREHDSQGDSVIEGGKGNGGADGKGVL